MTDALIGHTGFVGQSILRSRTFEARFRSTNIHEIRGQTFDLVVCCGAPAEKWRANAEPTADRESIRSLTSALESVRAREFLLVSTVDVYPSPVAVDETSPIDRTQLHAYGRHRLELEDFCRSRFQTSVVRLPALFGPGLKKNAVFDLLHDRLIDRIPPNATFQFYDMSRVWSDLERILRAKLTLVNITAEPIAMETIARQAFQRTLPAAAMASPPAYDVRSVHAERFGGADGYWYSADETMTALRAFVAAARVA
jgi:nucleoside-diphosphate-sugar epimerase